MTTQLVIFIAYQFAVLVVVTIIQPLQDWLLGMPVLASLLFLPHGLRVLSAWFLGWRAVPVLFAASAAGHLSIYDTKDPTLVTVSSLSSALCATVAMQIIFLAVPEARTAEYERQTWRILLLIAVIAAFFNMIGQTAALLAAGKQIVFQGIGDLARIFNFALGDTLGMVAVFALLTLFFRLTRPKA